MSFWAGATRPHIPEQAQSQHSRSQVKPASGRGHKVFLTCPVVTAATFAKRNIGTAFPRADTASGWASSKASQALVMAEIEIPPAPSFPFPQRYWLCPGHSGVVAGRIEFLASPRIVIRAGGTASVWAHPSALGTQAVQGQSHADLSIGPRNQAQRHAALQSGPRSQARNASTVEWKLQNSSRYEREQAPEKATCAPGSAQHTSHPCPCASNFPNLQGRVLHPLCLLSSRCTWLGVVLSHSLPGSSWAWVLSQGPQGERLVSFRCEERSFPSAGK
eukprot:5306990-Amphidinium_carterae.1